MVTILPVYPINKYLKHQIQSYLTANLYRPSVLNICFEINLFSRKSLSGHRPRNNAILRLYAATGCALKRLDKKISRENVNVDRLVYFLVKK